MDATPRISERWATPTCYRDVKRGLQGSRTQQSNGYSVKNTSYSGETGKIEQQAGMFSLRSDVREYVGLQATYSAVRRRRSNEQAGKSENYQWRPGMCRDMNSLTGYVVCGGRENRDF